MYFCFMNSHIQTQVLLENFHSQSRISFAVANGILIWHFLQKQGFSAVKYPYILFLFPVKNITACFYLKSVS